MKTNLIKKISGTLRGRLAIWYLASIGFFLLLFSMAVSAVFWLTLQEQIDHHVHMAVLEAQQIVQNYRGSERETLIRNLVGGQGMTVMVLSPDGSAILETNSPDVAVVTEHQLQKILMATGLQDTQPVHFTESSIRFAAIPAQVSAGKGIVAVGYSTKVLYATFYQTIGILAAVMVLLVLPTTYFGYQLLKQQLKPLESIAFQSKTVVNLPTLKRRIKLKQPTAELKTIQIAINSMLNQLEGVFKSERVFFADAAHTLKTPLAVLRSQIENSPLKKKSREEMLLTIDMANETVQDLILLSKIEHQSQSLKRFSLSRLLSDLAELAGALGEAQQLTVTTDIDKDTYITADEKLIRRSISNLVHNAVFYNRSGGQVKIRLKNYAEAIKITIMDTGNGIKESEKGLIFNRFFRGTNVKVKGSGLGLAISKAIIESFGGKIRLDSKIDQGTRVTVVFPKK